MRRILVVEDMDDAREAVAVYLRAQGYEVATAPNGVEALVAMRHRLPHLVLLDLSMPVLDGAGFRVEQLRDSRLAGVPVIVVSGESESANRARVLHAEGFLRKPVDMKVLLAQVHALIGAPRLARARAASR